MSQKFPVPEKLDAKGRMALAETRVALDRLQQIRLRVIADVKRAYFQLFVLDKSIELRPVQGFQIRVLCHPLGVGPSALTDWRIQSIALAWLPRNASRQPRL